MLSPGVTIESRRGRGWFAGTLRGRSAEADDDDAYIRDFIEPLLSNAW